VLRRHTPAILGRDRQPFPGSVARLERWRVGGVDQWVLIRGVDATQPALLVIPDGPGETLIPLARSFQRELERAFIVVNWDPRGCGLSYERSPAPGELTLDRLAADAVEVAGRISRELGKERVVLAGHGFGGVVGMLAAARAPEQFECYIGVGQWVEPEESGRRAMAWATAEAERKGWRVPLAGADPGPPRSDRSDGVDPRLIPTLRALGAWSQHPEGRAAERIPIASLSEYTLFDLLRRRAGIRRSASTVGREARAIDLPTRITRLDVPTYFIAGRFDHVVDPGLSREYLQVLDAPRKGWAWIEGTAHLAPFEEPDAYAAALAQFGHHARDPPTPRWALAG
jgi:pimeloyl-ACP methyl ester carboxylesterase